MENELSIRQRRRRLALTQAQFAKKAHMPAWTVLILENPKKMDEYRARYEASLKQCEREMAQELLQAA